MNQIRLIVDGVGYSGWEEVEITCGLQSFARTFKLTLTDKEEEERDDPTFNIKSQVEIYIGEDKVLTGYVTEITNEISAGRSSFTISGSGKGIDLVESSLPLDHAKSFKKTSVPSIVSSLSAPFGIGVVDDVGKTEKTNFNLSPEDKVGDAIKDLMAQYQFLLSDDANGDIHIVKVGGNGRSQTLEVGKNVLSFKRTQKTEKLFSEYVLMGQGTNPDSTREEDSHRLVETAHLSWRTRVDVVTPKGDASREKLKARAVALRDHSLGNVATYTVSVQGWRQIDGRLWQVNSMLLLDYRKKGIQLEVIVTQVTFKLNKDGMKAILTLKDIDSLLDVNCSHIRDISTKSSMNLKKIASAEGGEWTVT